MAALPERFGKYQVLERIARGGMAEIYRVKSVGIAGFEKILALKRVLPEFACEPRFIRSFIDEARIAVSLNHRSIVQVFDFGKAGGELYLAMELIDGMDLRRAVVESARCNIPMPVPVACQILGDVAAGLDYAHNKHDPQGRSLGIVHCDVSPQNVMLSSEGFVKLLDFGVSRARFSAQPTAGRIRGKPRYMAPEQARGERPTPASDVFALATIGWELLTGLRLFEGDTVKEILASVRRADAPPVHKLNPDVPRELSRGLWRALSPSPHERGDAADLARTFAATARGADGPAGAVLVARWMEQFLPPKVAHSGIEQTTVTASVDHTAASAPKITGSLLPEEPGLDWDEQEAATATTSAHLEPPAELVALVDKRRLVAVAALLTEVDDNARAPTKDHRKQLLQGLAGLSYKHGAVIYQQDDVGLVAVFGLEVAGDDDVAHAMGYCLDAVELARAIGAVELRLAARTGIVAQRRRSTGEYQLKGVALDEARALARSAQPGTPLLAGGPGRLASAHYAFRELPIRRPLGRRLRVLELAGPRSYDEHDRALRYPKGKFIGRAAELRQLTGAAERATLTGARISIDITGVAGVGKSRLIAEFVARAQGSERPRLIAVSVPPSGRDAPCSVLASLFQAALNLPPARGATARAHLTQRLRYVLEQAPWAPARVQAAVSALQQAMELRDAPSHAGGGLVTQELHDQLAAAMQLFRSASGADERLLIVVVEERHFIDSASAQVLREALRGAPPGPELWLFSSRPHSRPLAADLSVELELPELPPDDCEALICDRLGSAASANTIDAIRRRASGNPLFIEELSAAVRQYGDQQIPSTAREVILARVDRLPAAEKTTLQYAAVAGPSFAPRIIQELTGPRVHAHLRRLQRAGLLEPVDRGADVEAASELRFCHGLIQEVVYESLSPGARRETHARVGHLLASRYRAGRRESPSTIAGHFERSGEPSSAATYWLRAAEAAQTSFALATARDCFSRGLELTERVSDGDPGLLAERRRTALAGRERACWWLGDYATQGADLAALQRLVTDSPQHTADVCNRSAERLLQLGDRDGALVQLQRAGPLASECGALELQGESLRLTARAHCWVGKVSAAIAATAQAEELFQAGNAPTAVARTQLDTAQLHALAGRLRDARTTSERALARAVQLGDPLLQSAGRLTLATLQSSRGKFSDAASNIDRALASSEACGDRAGEAEGHRLQAELWHALGRYETAEEAASKALTQFRELGIPAGQAATLRLSGEVSTASGKPGAAGRQLDEALALARKLGAPIIESQIQVAVTRLLLQRGGPQDLEMAPAAAEAAVSRALETEIATLVLRARGLLALALFRTGKLSGATELSCDVTRQLPDHRWPAGAEVELLLGHHEILSAQGHPDARSSLLRARDLLERKLALIARPEWRASFIAAPTHRRILAAEDE